MTLDEAIELAIERTKDGCGTCNACTGCSGCKDAKYEFEEIAKFLTELKESREHPKVRHGRWIPLKGWFNKSIVKCSVCGNTLDMDGVNAGRGDANFCPNCGVKMDLRTQTEAALDIADSVMMGGDDNG